MLFTRLPRAVSAQTAVSPSAREATARWLPSMTSSPVNDPTMESKGRPETVVVVVNERPPSNDEATTTSARTSSGSPLRS